MKTHTTDLDRVIAANVRFFRLKRGWTQHRLATALNISFQQLQKIEKAMNRVPAGRLFEIADLLAIPMQAFREPRD